MGITTKRLELDIVKDGDVFWAIVGSPMAEMPEAIGYGETEIKALWECLTSDEINNLIGVGK